MNIPGFTAESALGAKAGVYRARNTRAGSITDTATGVITPALKRARSCTTTYRAYLSHYFPKKVCELAVPDLKLALGAVVAPTSGGQRSNKRNAIPFRVSDKFLRCRTITLPFIGEVTTTQNCDDALPDSSVLEVEGHPELSTFWTGGINEIPPPYNPGWFGVVGGETCNCCGATQQCPDGSCIPLTGSCTQFPA